ncbi:MAG TPA: DNA repair protein RadC [Rhabdochlamydiaceae bacterium]|jgi:DNA repair protein RadC|nr:DNA repair protein RadC [Rhabdochlamydiaceae bacterium]
MNLRKLPAQERPRERLVRFGPEALSLAELLAILLATGTKDKSVLELAHEMVVRFGSLQCLLEASIEEMMEVKGIGPAKAIQLKAAFGIALKTSQKTFIAKDPIHTREAYELVRHDLADQKQEMLMVILKDVKGRLIALEKVSIGTLSDVLVHPREIFFPAVRHKASSLILAHNHPSGDPTPSIADLELTKHLIRSSRIMGIHLDDHLIIGSSSFVSLRESGFLGFQARKA